MNIGIFLDLDGVITEKAVNLQFASMLGVESKLYALEDDYASGLINNSEFNEKLIPIFKSAGFTKQFAKENFKNIQLSMHTEELLQLLPKNTFIVSSSPSYYLSPFGKKYNIPQENIICSEYIFDSEGYITSCSSPCGVEQKAQFVKSKIQNFDLTVGVGDTPEQDAKFMSLCDIPILMNGIRRNYLSASDLYSVSNILSILNHNRDHLLQYPNECKDAIENLRKLSSQANNVFIITPFKKDVRYEVAIETIKDEISKFGSTAYIASDIMVDQDLWVGVRSYMHFCNSAIALITAYEEECGQGVIVKENIYNPNVMTEVGYMLGQNKPVLLLKDDRIKLPTDWIGKLYSPIDLKSPKRQIQKAVREWYSLHLKLEN